MSRKHFESLAAAIKFMCVPQLYKLECARSVADVCELHNEHFNRDKFMEACGL